MAAVTAAHFLRRRHGFDPRDIGTTVEQTSDLVGERGDGIVVVECPHRFEELAGGADRAGHDHRPRRRIGHPPRQLRSTLRQFVRASLCVVQLQAVRVAAERVGEDDVGPGIDELLVQAHHVVGSVVRPELGRFTGAEAGDHVVGAGGTVGQQHPPGGEKIGERSTHRPQGYPQRIRPPRGRCARAPRASAWRAHRWPRSSPPPGSRGWRR